MRVRVRVRVCQMSLAGHSVSLLYPVCFVAKRLTKQHPPVLPILRYGFLKCFEREEEEEQELVWRKESSDFH